MFFAVLLIFISSLLQALYSILLKKNTSTSTILLAHIFGGIIFLPLFYFVKDELYQLTKILHYVLFSGLCYSIIFWIYTKVYKKSADVSFIAPMQKAFSIISATIISFIIGFFTNSQVEISPFAYIGYVLIVISCVILPIKNFKDFKLKNYINDITILCFLSAFFSAISSYLDSASLNILSNDLPLWKKSFLFIAPYKFFIGIGMIPFLWFDDVKNGLKFSKEKPDLKQALIIGFSTGFCYILVFISYIFVKDTSYIIALRFMSLPMTIFGGVLVYQEKIYIGKSLGTILMILGLIIMIF